MYQALSRFIALEATGSWAGAWERGYTKPMTIVNGFGTRLDVRMCTRLKNSVLRNGEQPGSAGNSFFDYSKFEAIKSLSGWDAACCEDH